MKQVQESRKKNRSLTTLLRLNLFLLFLLIVFPVVRRLGNRLPWLQQIFIQALFSQDQKNNQRFECYVLLFNKEKRCFGLKGGRQIFCYYCIEFNDI